MSATMDGPAEFMEVYQEKYIEQMRESDLPAEEMETKIQEMKDFGELYKNPVVKIGMSYMEILPVGLVISRLCAAILRRKPQVEETTAIN